MTTTDPRFTDKQLMGRWFWWLVAWPMVKSAELQGRWIDYRARHNFGEVE